MKLLSIILFFNVSISIGQTKEEVYQCIVENDIKYPTIVLRQAIWESGWFKCMNCCRDFNNLFGFRVNSAVTKTNPQGYVKFKHWKESVVYYKWWQDEMYEGGDYYQFLINVGYAANGENYIKALKSLKI
jgi:uncharacterized FlgJ-related protein